MKYLLVILLFICSTTSAQQVTSFYGHAGGLDRLIDSVKADSLLRVIHKKEDSLREVDWLSEIDLRFQYINEDLDSAEHCVRRGTSMDMEKAENILAEAQWNGEKIKQIQCKLMLMHPVSSPLTVIVSTTFFTDSVINVSQWKKITKKPTTIKGNP